MEGGWGAGPWGRASWDTAWWEPAIDVGATFSDAWVIGGTYNVAYAESFSVSDTLHAQCELQTVAEAGVTMGATFAPSVVIEKTVTSKVNLSFTASAQCEFSQGVSTAFVLGSLFSTHTPVVPPGGNPWNPVAPAGAQVWTQITPGAGGIWAVESSTGAQSWGNIEPVTSPDWDSLN
jgi:hypothetical protein